MGFGESGLSPGCLGSGALRARDVLDLAKAPDFRFGPRFWTDHFLLHAELPTRLAARIRCLGRKA